MPHVTWLFNHRIGAGAVGPAARVKGALSGRIPPHYLGSVQGTADNVGNLIRPGRRFRVGLWTATRSTCRSASGVLPAFRQKVCCMQPMH